MSKEQITAKFQIKDEEGNAVVDGEGKATWAEATCEYDLGDNLDAACEVFGTEVVFSQYKAAARVALQNIIRTKLKANTPVDQIQSFLDTYKLGMVVEKTQVDPMTAVKEAFKTWSPEKQQEYINNLLSGTGMSL